MLPVAVAVLVEVLVGVLAEPAPVPNEVLVEVLG